MRILHRIVAILVLVMGLSGCVAYVALDPGVVELETRLAVTTDRQWSRMSVHGGRVWNEVWTVNGPLLDSLKIAAGIDDGKPLVFVTEEKAKNIARFRAGMGPEDLVGLVTGTLAETAGGKDFEMIRVAPDRVAEHEGVRFEFRFGTGAAGSGIETDRHAIGVAFEADKRLYVLLFHAAEMHYFEALRPAAEAVIRSARLVRQPRA